MRDPADVPAGSHPRPSATVRTPVTANSSMVASVIGQFPVRWKSEDGTWHVGSKGDIVFDDVMDTEYLIVRKVAGGTMRLSTIDGSRQIDRILGHLRLIRSASCGVVPSDSQADAPQETSAAQTGGIVAHAGAIVAQPGAIVAQAGAIVVQGDNFSSNVPTPLTITHREACLTLPLIHTYFVIFIMCVVPYVWFASCVLCIMCFVHHM